MMVFPDYGKQRILYFGTLGGSMPKSSAASLKKAGHRATEVSNLQFLQQYEETEMPFCKPGSGQAL